MKILRLWRAIKAHPHPAKYLTAIILWRTGLCRLLQINASNQGFRLRFYPSALSVEYWVDPRTRSHYAGFVQKYLRKDDKAIDVGANIGTTALASAAVVGKDGKITAFEPHPRIYNYLQGNIALNRFTNVDARKLAVGESQGVVVFSDSKWDDQNRVMLNAQGIEIDMQRLDDVMSSDETYRLLKIDSEGFELPILKGATQLLRKIECIYFEVSDKSGDYGYNLFDLLSMLDQAGFRIFILTHSLRLRSVPTNFHGTYRGNMLAIRDVDAFTGHTKFVLEEMSAE